MHVAILKRRESALQSLPVSPSWPQNLHKPGRKKGRAQRRYDAFIEGHRQAEEFGSAAPVVSATAELHLEAKRAKVAKMEQELAAASVAREEMEQRR